MIITKPSLTSHAVYHQEENFSHLAVGRHDKYTRSLSAASSDVCRRIIINHLSADPE